LKIEHIEELKKILDENSISPNDVCIVGSSVLAAHGIRKNKDIDIILSKDIRKLFTESDKAFNLTKNVECVGVGWLYNLDNRTKDEEIIYNSNKHFKKYNLKFCNMDLLLKRKKLSKREKDILDIKLINNASKNK
tara:strand:- start:60660 stop:61064 length:405 start_codon:yes stop_codon:yes gene_type:complete